MGCGLVIMNVWWITISLLTSWICAGPDCFDFLMKDVCTAYYDFGQCHLYQARRDCRRTCKVCGDGWSTWSAWKLCSAVCDGTQSRTRSCLSSILHCPGEDYEVQPCSRPGSICDGSFPLEEEETSGTDEEFLPEDLLKHVCDDVTFRCSEDSHICISNDVICNGYADCPNAFDEDFGSCALATISNSSFQIKNELMQTCLEVVTDDPLGPINGVRGYRRCPSMFSPHRKKYLWRWWKAYNLINLQTGQCLIADDPRRAALAAVRVEKCNSAVTGQHWLCDKNNQSSLLIRLRLVVAKKAPRFINLGEDASGWPLVFSANTTDKKSMWHKGPKEPPESICKDLQVYWSAWTAWSDCSLTCRGGKRSRTKSCVNGEAGIPPCEGTSVDTEPCNSDVSCKKIAGLHLNSKCRNGYVNVGNDQRMKSRHVLDPACYLIDGLLNPKTYEEAREACKLKHAELASIKTEIAQEFVTNIMENNSIESELYFGAREDFSALPVLGHQFRFGFDGTPVGSFTPWKDDCIMGPGFGYQGKQNVAFDPETNNEIKCQPWSSRKPHKVKYKLFEDDDSDADYCRNPNLDIHGPWCYTLDPKVEKAYCNIPECSEFLAPYKLNEEGFQIVRNEKGFLYETKGGGATDSSKSLCMTADGVKRFGPTGEPRSMWLRLKDCEKFSVDEEVPVKQRFVWDISRKRILHDETMLCIAASSGRADSEIQLESCSAEKATQRLRIDGSMILLDLFHSSKDLHLDVSPGGNTLVASSLELRAWTALTVGGYKTDLLGLRKAYEDESFELYNVVTKTCLALDVNGTAGKSPTLNIGHSGALSMLRCAGTAQFQFMRFPASPNLILHVQTSLCLTVEQKSYFSKVFLSKCSVVSDHQWWTCSGLHSRKITLQANSDFSLSVRDGSVILDMTSNSATWIAWGSRNRTTCQFKVPSGGELIGSPFAIKNQRNGKCLQHDKMGNMIFKECAPYGERSGELWSFTRAPTMIRQVISGKCLRASSAMSGAAVMSYKCRAQDAFQHWTLIKMPFESSDETGVPYYSLHLVMNLNLAVAVDGKNSKLKLHENTAVFWDAFGKSHAKMSPAVMTDCAVHISDTVYYGGTTSFTRKGKRCIPWAETRLGAIFPDLESNYCRNPGRKSSEPWCYVRSDEGIIMKEVCGIPACVPVKVKTNRKGEWLPTAGMEKLPYLCQAEPECYRDIGMDYVGLWNVTRKGYCAFWKDHKESGYEKNYCRNPNGAKSGPWCYTSVLKTSKETCPLPKCHDTCLRIPEKLYQGDLIRYKFSASVYGAEGKSITVKRCHKGYWIRKHLYSTDNECSHGVWKPELEPCEVITCSEFDGSVGGAVLSASSSSLYNHFTYFTCHPGLLAGPGKAKVTFRCNEFGEWEKTDESAKNCTSPCDDGWKSFREHCYKTFPVLSSFSASVELCNAKGGSLTDLDDKIMYEFITQLVLESGAMGANATYWLAIKDFWEGKGNSDLNKREFRSVNYANKGDLFKDKGVGYLPIIYQTFRIMHFSYGRANHDFKDLLPYKERCMFGYDHTDYVVSRACADYNPRRLLWSWITPFHLFHVATGKCLTGTPSNGKEKEDEPVAATLKPCERKNKNQYVTCKRHGPASLRLMFNEESYFVDDVATQPWDKVIMGNRIYNSNLSHWIIDETELDVCHYSVTRKGNLFLLWEGVQAEGKSYDYEEAKKKCEDFGGELPKRLQVMSRSKDEDISACACAWISTKQQVNVHRQRSEGCKSSLTPGVKSCAGQPKADVFCFRGKERKALDIPYGLILLLESTEKQGVQERSTEEPHNVICRKPSRWHCPPPPRIPRAKIEETIETSYNYLGFTTYNCIPGYWFGRGEFSKVVRCTYKLQWDPDPSSLSCEPLHCPPPAEIANSNLTVHSVDINGKAEYHCLFGFQFQWSVFDMTVTCSSNAYWNPSPATQQCRAVTCRPPPSVDHSTHSVYSLSYPYNTTYTCDDGYWFAANVYETKSMCNGDALWTPNPNTFTCWEIVCPAFKPRQNMIFDRKGVKRIDVRCERGYFLRSVNEPDDMDNVTLMCQNDGNWFPVLDIYYCKPLTCGRPPDVKSVLNSADKKLESFRPGSHIQQFCDIGSTMLRSFTLYNPLRQICLTRGINNAVVASSDGCMPDTILRFQWYKTHLLLDVNSSLCLGAEEIPTRLDSRQKLLLKDCNATDMSQHWRCSEFKSTTLLLGINSSTPAYIVKREPSGAAYVNLDESEWLEWIDYAEKDKISETSVCQYQIPGSKQNIVCSLEGKWIPDPVRIMKCNLIKCSSPPKIRHGSFKIMTDRATPGSFLYATPVMYTCNKGYEFFKNRITFITRCTEFGVWAPDPSKMSCLPKRCPLFKVPRHGIVAKGNPEEDFEYLDEIHVICPNGWMLRPGNFETHAKCNAYGKWDVTVPADSCRELVCGPPPELRHGIMKITSTKLTFNTVARYTCREGKWFYPGKNWRETFCQKTGFWEPDPSTFLCIEATCDEPTAVLKAERDGAVARKYDGRYPFGSMVYLKCSKGWIFGKGIKKITITCKQDSLWHPDPFYLKCVEMQCPMPHPLPKHSFLVGEHRGIGAIIGMDCANGYRLKTRDSKVIERVDLVCLEALTWNPSPESVSCVPILCKKPLDIRNSVKLPSSLLFGSFVQYVCNVGYWIRFGMHHFITECMADGSWFPDPSRYVCEIVFCGFTPTPENAISTVRSFKYRGPAMTSCVEGFWAAGVFSRFISSRCGANGLWDPLTEKVVCVAVKCLDPGKLPRAKREIANSPPDSGDNFDMLGNHYFFYGTRLTYKCDEGLQFSYQTAQITTTCTKTGLWSQDVTSMTCSDVTCEFTQGVLYGHIIESTVTSTLGYVMNTTLVITCHKGYWFTRNVYTKKVVCMSNNKWSVKIDRQVCIRVTCQEPPTIEHAKLVRSGYSVTDKTTYACEKGYKMVPENEIICSENGTWDPDPKDFSCKPVECTIPLTITNVDMFAVKAPTTRTYGDILELTCTENFFFLPGQNKAKIQCSESGRWINDSVLSGCYDPTSFPCVFPLRIKNAHLTQFSGNNVSFDCFPGHFFDDGSYSSASVEEWRQRLVFSCSNSVWTPDPTSISCLEYGCPLSEDMLTPNSKILDVDYSDEFKFGHVLTVTCDAGFSLLGKYRKRGKFHRTSVNITCSGKYWIPDPKYIFCAGIFCDEPTAIEDAVLTPLSEKSKTKPPGKKYPYKIISYQCSGTKSFSRDSTSLESYCTEYGVWNPDPKTLKCRVYKCLIPDPPPNAIVSMEARVDGLQVLRISCVAGFWINNVSLERSQRFSERIQCNSTGQWEKAVDSIICEPVKCGPFPDIPNAIQSASVAFSKQGKSDDFFYGHQVTYTCFRNTWFSDVQSSSRSLLCGDYGTWTPNSTSFKCVKVVCPNPPHLLNAITSGNKLSVGSIWKYKCTEGYIFGNNAYEISTTCQSTGKWMPYPSKDFQCKQRSCPKPPNLRNIESDAMNYNLNKAVFAPGSEVIYRCIPGYWFTLGLRRPKVLHIKCQKGAWMPPLNGTTGCDIVVCDIPPVVEGALVEGISHYFEDRISYVCAKGLHFYSLTSRRTDVTCDEDGFWTPNVYDLECTNVLCRDISIPGALKNGDGSGMDATVIFKCPKPTWFGRNETEALTVCDENGNWDPDLQGKSCKIIDCGQPDLDHALILETNYIYNQSVKLGCLPGYYMLPRVLSKPSARCDINGNWYPDPRNYKCQAIKCREPPFVLHATLSGDITYSSMMRVTCDKGYFFRVGTNYADVECLEDGTWSDNFLSMNCIPVRCVPPPRIESTISSIIGAISPPNYGSELRYKCFDKLWISSGVDAVDLRCNETGLWYPDEEYQCIEKTCPGLPFKKGAFRNYPTGVKNTSEYKSGTELRYECHASLWLSVQHDLMEWSFTGFTSVSVICNDDGRWIPHVFSFSCRNLNQGPIPIGMEQGISLSDVLQANWTKKAGIDGIDILSHQYAKAIVTGASSWVDGSMFPEEMPIQSATNDGSPVIKLWDGNPETHWIPKQNEAREYEFVIYLGGLFFIEGFEIHSEAVEKVPASPVVSFELAYSSDARKFSSYHSYHMTASNIGRLYPNNTGSNTKGKVPVYFDKERIQNTTVSKKSATRPLQFLDLSFPAKFVKVKITATQNFALPPIIQDIRMKLSSAKWIISYPIDYFTMPSIVVSAMLLATLIYLAGYWFDKFDTEKIFFSFDWRNFVEKGSYFCIKLKLSDFRNTERVVCSLHRGEKSYPVISIKPSVHRLNPNQEIILFTMANTSDLPSPSFIVGYTSDTTTDFKAKRRYQKLDLKIAKIAYDEALFGRLNWIKVVKGMQIFPYELTSVNFEIPSGLVSEQSHRNFPKEFMYQTITNHTLLSVFVNDFLLSLSRKDRTAITFFSCFLAMLIASGLLLLQPVINQLTCTGIGIVSSLLALPVLFITKRVYSKLQIFLDVKKSPRKAHLAGVSTRKVFEKEKPSNLSEVQKSTDDSGLEVMMQKFKANDVTPTLMPSDSVKAFGYSILKEADSLLLPKRFRQKHHNPDLNCEITLERLESAARARLRRSARLTKSCYAILQYGTLKPTIPSPIPYDDVMSCMSMWSQSTIARAWHSLHTSVNTPVKRLFRASGPRLQANFKSRQKQYYSQEKNEMEVESSNKKVWRFASFKDGQFSADVQHENKDMEILGPSHLVYQGINAPLDKNFSLRRMMFDLHGDIPYPRLGALSDKTFEPDRLFRPEVYGIDESELTSIRQVQDNSSLNVALYPTTGLPSIDDNSSTLKSSKKSLSALNVSARAMIVKQEQSLLGEVIESKTVSESLEVSPQRVRSSSILFGITMLIALTVGYFGCVESTNLSPVICAQVTVLCMYFAIILPAESMLRYKVFQRQDRLSLKKFFNWPERRASPARPNISDPWNGR